MTTYTDAFAIAAAATKNKNWNDKDQIAETDFSRLTAAVLVAGYGYNYGTRFVYDFLNRVVMMPGQTIHFKDCDREVLTTMRDKLIELGGSPPPLPEEKNPFSLTGKTAVKTTAPGAP